MARQDKFLQIYRLPTPLPDVSAFARTLLGLIKLIQSALALFGLGPFATETPDAVWREGSSDTKHSESRSDELEPDGLRNYHLTFQRGHLVSHSKVSICSL
jgi:hypothetical protein